MPAEYRVPMTEPDIRKIETADTTWYVSILLIILIAGSVCRIAVSFSTPLAYMADDAFITFRYAKNITEGAGFVYNGGERILGTTTPLFTIFTAASGMIFGIKNIPVSGLILSTVFSILSLILFAHLLYRHCSSKWVVLAMSCAVAFGPTLISSASTGMETSTVICFMVASLHAAASGWIFLCAGIAGLMLMLRPDCILWTATLFIWLCINNRRFLWKELFLGLIIVSPWLVFSFYYFGSPIPQTIAGKGSTALSELSTAEYVLRALRAYHISLAPSNFLEAASTLFILLMLPVGIWQALAAAPVLMPLIAWFFLYVAVFILGKAPLFDWYYVPPRLVLYSLVVTGALAMTPVKNKNYLALIITAVACPFYLINFSYTSENKATESQCVLELLQRKSDDTIYLEHIGYIGFFLDNYIYDSEALVSPQLLGYKLSDVPHLNAVKEFKPDIVIVYDSEMTPDLEDGLSSDYDYLSKCDKSMIYSKRNKN